MVKVDKGKTRIRDPHHPRVTYHADENRTFIRMFNEGSLNDLKNVVRNKLGVSEENKIGLLYKNGEAFIDLADEDDFDVFYAIVKEGLSADVYVSITKASQTAPTATIAPTQGKRKVTFSEGDGDSAAMPSKKQKMIPTSAEPKGVSLPGSSTEKPHSKALEKSSGLAAPAPVPQQSDSRIGKKAKKAKAKGDSTEAGVTEQPKRVVEAESSKESTKPKEKPTGRKQKTSTSPADDQPPTSSPNDVLMKGQHPAASTSKETDGAHTDKKTKKKRKLSQARVNSEDESEEPPPPPKKKPKSSTKPDPANGGNDASSKPAPAKEATNPAPQKDTVASGTSKKIAETEQPASSEKNPTRKKAKKKREAAPAPAAASTPNTEGSSSGRVPSPTPPAPPKRRSPEELRKAILDTWSKHWSETYGSSDKQGTSPSQNSSPLPKQTNPLPTPPPAGDDSPTEPSMKPSQPAKALVSPVSSPVAPNNPVKPPSRPADNRVAKSNTVVGPARSQLPGPQQRQPKPQSPKASQSQPSKAAPKQSNDESEETSSDSDSDRSKNNAPDPALRQHRASINALAALVDDDPELDALIRPPKRSRLSYQAILDRVEKEEKDDEDESEKEEEEEAKLEDDEEERPKRKKRSSMMKMARESDSENEGVEWNEEEEEDSHSGSPRVAAEVPKLRTASVSVEEQVLPRESEEESEKESDKEPGKETTKIPAGSPGEEQFDETAEDARLPLSPLIPVFTSIPKSPSTSRTRLSSQPQRKSATPAKETSPVPPAPEEVEAEEEAAPEPPPKRRPGRPRKDRTSTAPPKSSQASSLKAVNGTFDTNDDDDSPTATQAVSRSQPPKEPEGRKTRSTARKSISAENTTPAPSQTRRTRSTAKSQPPSTQEPVAKPAKSSQRLTRNSRKRAAVVPEDDEEEEKEEEEEDSNDGSLRSQYRVIKTPTLTPSWTALDVPDSVATQDSHLHSQQVDELQSNTSPIHHPATSEVPETPLFLGSQSQPTILSQWPETQLPDSRDEEDEVEALAASTPTLPQQSQRGFYPRLSQLASQTGIFNALSKLRPAAIKPTEAKDLYGLGSKDDEEEEEESDDDDSEEEQASHIPRSRMAGVKKK